MAVTVEELRAVLRMEMKPFMRDLQQLNGVNAKSARQVERVWRNTNRQLDGIGRSMARSLTVPLTAVAAAASVREVQHYADAWTEAGNKIRAAGQIAGREGRSLEGINEIANRTRSGIVETTDLYAKLLRSTANVAKSEEEVARATEIVNKAFKAGGAATSEQVAGILQLSQALGSGIFQGDELRSVRENAPLIAQAIADEFKTTIAGLKDLGAEGKLTTERVFKAILAAQPQIEAAFGKTNQTIADGLTKVGNALTQYIGQSDDSLSATERVVAGLNALADNFDQTADVVLKFAAVIAGALVGRSLTMMIAKLGLGAAALVNFVRAAKTMAGLSAAFSGIGAAAGPVGLLIGGAVVGSLALFASTSSEASNAARTYAEALASVEEAANKVPAAVDGATAKIDEKLRNSLSGGIDEGVQKIEEARAAAVSLFTQIIDNAPRRLISDEQLKSLETLRDELKNGEKSSKDVENALFALANGNPNFQRLAEQLSPLLVALGNAIAATDLLRGKLSGLGGNQTNWREAEDKSMAAYADMQKTSKAFLDEATRRNSLTKEQLALETEIAKVRKEADKAGAVLTDAQIKSLAQSNLAAGNRRSSEGRGPKSVKKTTDDVFEQNIQSIRDRTAALVSEREALGANFYEQTRRSIALELEQDALKDVQEAARKKGDTDWRNAQLTPDQIAKINEVSEAYAAQAEALRIAQEAQQEFEDWMDLARGSTRGFIDDLLNGVSAGEAFANVLKRIGDRLLDLAMNDLFGNANNGWGLIGSLLGGLGGASDPWGGLRANGGPVQAGKAYIVGEKRPELFVPNQSGTIVPQVPVMPTIQASGAGSSVVVNFNPVIDNRGASAEAVARTQQQLDKLKAQLPSIVTQSVRQANKSNVKF